ncbi:MAG: hypothetical protein IJF92_03710 [Bacilli bacterium]|nr:hypothetical protein [Bacilli bacterium]
MKDIKRFYKDIKNIKYGWHDKDGKVHTKISGNNFIKEFRMQKVKNIKKSNYAICWEMCELERNYFKKRKIKHKVIFVLSREDNKYYCHTFLVFKPHKHYYYFEGSWDKYKGIHKYNSLEEILEFFKNNFSDFIGKKKYDKNKIYFYEYKKPRFIKKCNPFYFFCMHSKKINY